MVANAGLPPDHDAVPDHGATCDTHLAANNTMSSKSDIVRNVHEVIENGARSDYGVTGRASVYRAVRTNLDIVLDNDTAKLRNAQSPIRRWHEAETLSANADARRDLDSGAYDGVAYAAACPDGAVIAKYYAAANDSVTSDVATRPDFCTRADNGSCVNSRRCPDDGARIDPRIGGNLRLWPAGRVIQKADLGKSQLRLGHAHETHPTGSVLGKVSGRDDSGRLGLAKGTQIL